MGLYARTKQAPLCALTPLRALTPHSTQGPLKDQAPLSARSLVMDSAVQQQHYGEGKYALWVVEPRSEAKCLLEYFVTAQLHTALQL